MKEIQTKFINGSLFLSLRLKKKKKKNLCFWCYKCEEVTPSPRSTNQHNVAACFPNPPATQEAQRM